MTKIRIGIIGCGEAAQVLHLPSLHQLSEQFTVTALCDVSQQVVQAVGDQWNVSARFQDYRQLLAQADVDAVLIANPDAYHAEVTLAAIAEGKHVLVEKPLCLSLQEADLIRSAETAAQEAGRSVTVQVGYMRRYAPAFIKACRLLPELGPVRLARVHDVLGSNSLFIQDTSLVVRGDDLSPTVAAEARQMREQRIGGALDAILGAGWRSGDENSPGKTAKLLPGIYGLLLGLSSHDLSAMRELLGVPKRVLYAAARQNGLYISAAFDYGDFVCNFETGIDSIARFDAYLEVYGAEKVLRVDYNTPYVRNLPITVSMTEANGSGGVQTRCEHPAWGDAFVAEWRAFHANVTQRSAPKTTPADFRLDLELFGEMVRLIKQEMSENAALVPIAP